MLTRACHTCCSRTAAPGTATWTALSLPSIRSIRPYRCTGRAVPVASWLCFASQGPMMAPSWPTVALTSIILRSARAARRPAGTHLSRPRLLWALVELITAVSLQSHSTYRLKRMARPKLGGRPSARSAAAADVTVCSALGHRRLPRLARFWWRCRRCVPKHDVELGTARG